MGNKSFKKTFQLSFPLKACPFLLALTKKKVNEYKTIFQETCI